MGKYRKLQQRRGWAFWVAPPLVKAFLLSTTKRDWVDAEKLPETGGCVVALNHVSHLDPFTAAHMIWDYGRLPRYLAKSGLFKNKRLASFLLALGQIPVDREKAGTTAFQAAVDAVNRGEVVVVYVEGSITKDPDGWPMLGKSGAARIALETGAPVYPVGQWGAQELLPAYSARFRPFPRKTVHMKVGDPVELSDLAAREHTPEVVREATDRIMHAIVRLVADLRGLEPPEQLFDPKKAGVRAIGNPRKNQRKGRS